jgi:hypothetical protein
MSDQDQGPNQQPAPRADWTPRVVAGPAAAVQASAPSQAVVAFDRFELREILNLYGRKVAAGEWRDYEKGVAHRPTKKAPFSRGLRLLRCAAD